MREDVTLACLGTKRHQVEAVSLHGSLEDQWHLGEVQKVSADSMRVTVCRRPFLARFSPLLLNLREPCYWIQRIVGALYNVDNLVLA